MEDNLPEHIDPIEELFRDGLRGHEEMPPLEVWEGISSSLDAQDKAINRGEKAFWQQYWFKGGVVFLSAVALVYFIYWLNLPKHTTDLPKIDPKYHQDKVPLEQKTQVVSPVQEELKTQKIEKESTKTKSTLPQNATSGDSVKQEIPVKNELRELENEAPQQIKEEKKEVVEPEPENLYDRVKQEQGKKESRPLFIEKEK